MRDWDYFLTHRWGVIWALIWVAVGGVVGLGLQEGHKESATLAIAATTGFVSIAVVILALPLAAAVLRAGFKQRDEARETLREKQHSFPNADIKINESYTTEAFSEEWLRYVVQAHITNREDRPLSLGIDLGMTTQDESFTFWTTARKNDGREVALPVHVHPLRTVEANLSFVVQQAWTKPFEDPEHGAVHAKSLRLRVRDLLSETETVRPFV